MSRIKLDLDTIRFINTFESVTRASVKDCITSESKFIFVVRTGQIGKAIGKQGVNIKRMENMLKKKIRIIEYNDNIEQFIRNLIHPLKLNSIEQEDKIVTLEAIDSKTRGILIGRNASNLREHEAVVKRYFPITEIKVK